MSGPINETIINVAIKGIGPINKVIYSKAMSIHYNGNLVEVNAILPVRMLLIQKIRSMFATAVLKLQKS